MTTQLHEPIETRPHGARSVHPTACLTLLSVLLFGCGEAGTTRVKSEAAASDASEAQTEAMVSAVSSGKPGAAVDLKFDIGKRPRAGEPLEVTVAVTTRAADIDKLQVMFQSTEGVEVVGGAQLGPVATPADGQVFSHTVRVLPKQDGVYYLSAVALVDSASAGGPSLARTFAIPIIVGDSVSLDAAMSKAAAEATTEGPGGEALVPLPAEESGAR
jgi:hypothetical protein